LETLQGNLMKLIDGYENDSGVFLRYTETQDDQVIMDIKHYAPNHAEFAWALEQLRTLEE
jgi:hypothetical protein